MTRSRIGSPVWYLCSMDWLTCLICVLYDPLKDWLTCLRKRSCWADIWGGNCDFTCWYIKCLQVFIKGMKYLSNVLMAFFEISIKMIKLGKVKACMCFYIMTWIFVFISKLLAQSCIPIRVCVQFLKSFLQFVPFLLW